MSRAAWLLIVGLVVAGSLTVGVVIVAFAVYISTGGDGRSLAEWVNGAVAGGR